MQSSECDAIDLPTVLGKYLENRQPATDFAAIMGQTLASAASILPYAKQVKLLTKVMDVVTEVLNENELENS